MRSVRARHRAVSLGLLACVAGCGTTAVSTTAHAPAAEVAEASGRPADPQSPAPAVAPDAPEAVVFALAKHVARAERWLGRTRVIELRGAGAAKYTLGGFTSDLALGDEGAVAVTARVEARIPGGIEGPATLWLDTDAGELREVALDGAVLAAGGVVGTYDVPDGALALGEHTLRVWGRREGFALRAIRVGPRGELDRRAPSAATTEALRFVAGERIGFTMSIPTGARFRATARGTLTVEALDEAGVLHPVAEGSDALDVDLGRFEGKTIRIELSARGEVELASPRIVVPGGGAVREARAIRNVVVYLVDTWRADKLRPYRADTRVTTPALDAFASRATVFGAAHAQECWTKPSVATLLSGLFPWEHTAVGGESLVPASVRLLPETLAERGFETAAFIANGYVSDRFGFGRGWRRYTNYLREGKPTYAANVIADVIRFLDRRDASSPFFVYVHTIDPHVPYRPHEGIFERYGDPSYRGPVTFARDAMLLEKIKLGQLRIGDRDRAQLEALYDNEITYHDVHFGQLVEALSRRGLDDDTLVVVTSDHGEEFFDHGSVGHGHSVYEELIHVPLFVRIPGESPARLDAAVGLVDVAPTIFDLLGIEGPPTSGRSLAPLLRGETDDAPRATVSGFMDNHRSVVLGEWKLIQRTRGRYALYDLRQDPGETRDVASEHPLAVELLRGALGLELGRASEPIGRAGGRRTTPPPRHQAERTTIDPETEAQLRAIGYAN